jgi:hypothetical protein
MGIFGRLEGKRDDSENERAQERDSAEGPRRKGTRDWCQARAGVTDGGEGGG